MNKKQREEKKKREEELYNQIEKDRTYYERNRGSGRKSYIKKLKGGKNENKNLE